MWDDRFIFVLSALFGVSLWIVIVKRREAIKAGRQPWFAYGLLTLIITAIALILVIRYLGPNTDTGLKYPSLGLVLAFIIGGAVGSFSARFVWSLFGARFGAKDPLIGVLALLLLVIVYSLPVYQREISAFLGHVGLSSLKTPIGELTFTERSRFQGAVVSAAKPSGEERSSALPRPSYPRPGLDALRHAVSEGPNDYLTKDARYIAFFNGRGDFQPRQAPLDDVMVATRAFLRPAKTLARCLRAYVDIIPDSQLLLVDVKPVIQFFFRMHANAVAALGHDTDRPEHPNNDVNELYGHVKDVRLVVLKAIGSTRDASAETNLKPDEALGEQPRPVETGESENFAERCRADNLELSAESSQNLKNNFTYLQPYVTIALANLLVAHGSPDEAIDVITQWLNLWRCARGEGTDGKQRPAKCNFGPLPAKANELPEWFGIRAEFELNVLLFQQAGEANITYRDFLRDHAEHFKNYAAKPRDYDRRGSPALAAQVSAGISIREELERCKDRKMPESADAASGANTRAIILRSLLQNEDTLLRSELHFLAGSNWADMENLHERGLALTRFSVGCINPEGGEEKVWKATLANYKITSGLLALAIADRLATTAASVDDRNRADEIRNEGKQQLRNGYRLLKEFRDADRREIALLPWSERVFNVSQWEESCSLAERAIHQLNEASP